MRSHPRCGRSPRAPRPHDGRLEPSRRCSGRPPVPPLCISTWTFGRPIPTRSHPSATRIPGVRRPPAARALWLDRIAAASSSGTSGSVPIWARTNVSRSAAVDRRAPAPVRPGIAQRPAGPPHPFVPAARRLRWSSLRVITVSRRPRGVVIRSAPGLRSRSQPRGRARCPAHPRRSSSSGIARRRRLADGSSRALRGRPPSRGGRRDPRGGGARAGGTPGAVEEAPTCGWTRSTSLIGRPSRIGTRVPRGRCSTRGSSSPSSPRSTAIASRSEVNTFVIEPISKTARSGAHDGSGSGPRDANAVSSPSVALTTRRPGRRPARRSAASTRVWSSAVTIGRSRARGSRRASRTASSQRAPRGRRSLGADRHRRDGSPCRGPG